APPLTKGICAVATTMRTASVLLGLFGGGDTFAPLLQLTKADTDVGELSPRVLFRRARAAELGLELAHSLLGRAQPRHDPAHPATTLVERAHHRLERAADGGVPFDLRVGEEVYDLRCDRQKDLLERPW